MARRRRVKAIQGIAVLATLAVLAGGALAWFSQTTEEAVRRNRQAAEARVVRELAGADVAFAPATTVDAGEDVVLFCERELVVLRGGGRGYGGAFRLAVAVGADGAVAGVRVIEHRETPGFGDILEAGTAWLDSFRAGEPHAVTGATVTSTAVIAAVQRLAARGRQEACVR